MALALMKVRRIIRAEVDVPELGKRIESARRTTDMSVAEVCRAVGFSRTYWYRLVNEQEEAVSEETLRKLEKIFAADFNVKFADEGC